MAKHFLLKYDLYCFSLPCFIALTASNCLHFLILSLLLASPTTATNEQNLCQCSFLQYVPYFLFNFFNTCTGVGEITERIELSEHESEILVISKIQIARHGQG